MANDSDWVADVKRWYFSSRPAQSSEPVVPQDSKFLDVGYEAAHPSTQATTWAEQSRNRSLG